MDRATLARTPGFQFLTFPQMPGENVAINGITGDGPGVVRGTDPATYLSAILGYTEEPAAVAGSAEKEAPLMQRILAGAGGVLLAVVLVGLGTWLLVQGVRTNG